MRTRTWSVAAAMLIVSIPAGAQTVLSEADALARLSADSPRVRAIRAGVAVAEAEVLAAARRPNPRVSFNRESVSGVTENMVTVTQPLPITGRRQLEVSSASATADAAARRAEDDIRRARAELRMAYADLVSAQLREAELTRVRDRLRDLAAVLARRESAGDAAGYDRLRAEREVTDIETDWSAARADRVRAQSALAAFFGDPGDVTAIVARSDGAVAHTPLPTVEQLIERSSSRGESAALQLEISSAQFAARAAARRVIPEPEVVAGTKSSNAAGGDIGSVVSVHATIPLFDRARPEKALAHARLVQAEARASTFRTIIAAQISALRSLVAERREAADRYRATSTTSAAQLERIAQVSYDAGERGILELLDAYRTGAAARTRQAVLDAAVRQAEIELEFVSGWEML